MGSEAREMSGLMAFRNAPAATPLATPETVKWLEGIVSRADQEISDWQATRTSALGMIALAKSEIGRAALVSAVEEPSKLPAHSETHAPRSTGTNLAPSAQGKIPPDIDLTGLEVDLEGARNSLDRIVKIAENADVRLLNTTQIARLILRAGVSTGALQSVRTGIHRAFKDNPTLFRPVRDGTYQYLGNNSHAENEQSSPQAHPSQDVPEIE